MSEPTTDLFGLEVADALAGRGCPLCAVLAKEEERYVRWYWDSARDDRRVRERFVRAGGFCRPHATQLAEWARAAAAPRAVASLYRDLIARDLALLERVAGRLGASGRRPRASLERAGACPACAWMEGAEPRKAAFLVETLYGAGMRRAYEASDGLCFPHLDAALDAALADGRRDTGRWLLADWRERLAADAEAASPERLLARYVGTAPGGAGAPGLRPDGQGFPSERPEPPIDPMGRSLMSG